MEEVHVVTCFLRNGSDVLLFRRSEAVGSYRGQWGAVAGHAEGDPDGAAREEIGEETGLADAIDLVRAGEPFPVEDAARGTRWVVHPYLFDCDSRDVTTNYETSEHEWVPPTGILRRETIPDLWESYRRVRPTVASVREDREHGAASLSLRALEVLRDRAAERAAEAVADGADGDWSKLAALARNLLDARASMAVVRNRVNRAMHDASEGRSAAVEAAAQDGIDRALAADEAAAERAATELDGTVLTLSRSGTVRAALERAGLDRLLVAESRPGGEGVGVAESFAAAASTTLLPDSAVAHALATEDVDAVVVGADTVLPDGSVVNKVGTRGAALAAAHEGVPVYVVTARDKVSADPAVDLEPLGAEEVYDGEVELDVLAPTFDVTPADLVRVVTEDGVLSADEVRAVAAEHRSLADWS